MIEGKTRTGFKFKIDERIKNDWRLIDAISRVSKDGASLAEKATATAELVDLLCGNCKADLMAHIQKKNDGFVPADALERELFDMITEKNVKKSQSSPD